MIALMGRYGGVHRPAAGTPSQSKIFDFCQLPQRGSQGAGTNLEMQIATPVCPLVRNDQYLARTRRGRPLDVPHAGTFKQPSRAGCPHPAVCRHRRRCVRDDAYIVPVQASIGRYRRRGHDPPDISTVRFFCAADETMTRPFIPMVETDFSERKKEREIK